MKIIKQENKIIVDTESFNIKAILECGQVFSYHKLTNDKYLVVSMDNVATVSILQDKTIIESNKIDYFYNFFDFNTDYKEIERKIIEISPNYKEMIKDTLRILKQDPYQTIISFIVSANNNIKRIKGILDRLCIKYGTYMPNYKCYSFPTLNQISLAKKEDFIEIGAGYRSDYLCKTIKQLQQPRFNMDKLINLSTNELKSRLLELSGIGPKVADCILFFGFGRTDVFIVDTWIKKAYSLFSSEIRNEKQISDYFIKKFGELSGYAQQYLFNYMINKDI